MGSVWRCSFAALVTFLIELVVIEAQETTVGYHIPEEKNESFYVGNVARDSLLYGNVTMEEFQRMKFQILTQGNQFASMFTIDESSSTLRTDAVLDREDICPDMLECELSFNIAVYIKGAVTESLDLYKIIRIIVTLEDVNDNAPEFPHSEVAINIAENTDRFGEFFTNGAIDLDTGANNSVQKYYMEPPNEMFGLNVLNNSDGTSDLNIVVKYPLDRESRNFYQLKIFAADGGFPLRSGSVKINITITDQNDNFPVFSKPAYDVTVQENQPVNSTILVLSATDSDEDNNGLVSYKFSSRTSSKITDVFDINETTGDIVIKSLLDYEVNRKWTFQVEAYDNGSPHKSTKVKVIVNVGDINDNYPQVNINLPPGGTKILESAETGSFVAHVAVFDLDAGVNGQINCEIHGDDFRLEDFKIDNNYKVVLNQQLDHEVTGSYEVNIKCQDGGKPPKTNSTSFTVQVEDINDNFPQFSLPQYELTIQEEIQTTTIVQVQATDADSGNNGKIMYRLHEEATELFAINGKTGLITANSVFDREVTPVIRFRVLAWDGGDPSLTSTANVVINVTDINDNAPGFPLHPVELHVLEEQVPQTVVLEVSDPDFGLNGQFVLSFPQNDYLSKYFTFDSVTGTISVVESIDREEIPYFQFWVTAVDRGIPQRSSSAEIVLMIDDKNDNIPAITYPNNFNNTRKISVTAPEGLLIADVEAHDKDVGRNAQLLYFIEKGDPRGIFNIDVNSGRISVARDMDAKDADAYKLDIAVRDNGEIQRTSWAKLHVIVEQTNDTLAAPQDEDNQNITIVVIFVVITVALSIGIIGTIFIIRHLDRRNRPQPGPKMMESRYYETAKVDESMSASSSGSKDSDAELLKKRAKKEVSFSIDECDETMNNSTLTNVTSFSTVKNLPSYLSMDYKPEDTQSTTWLCNSSGSTDFNKTDLYSEKELSSLEQVQRALDHIQTHPDRIWIQPVHQQQSKRTMLKKGDDNHSETSGETANSDSGRGGSEEDIHSNRGHRLSDSEEGKPYYPSDNRHSHQLKFIPRRPPPPIPADSFKRNISFSDDSVNANTTICSYGKPPLTSDDSGTNTTVSSYGKIPITSLSISDYKTPLHNKQGLFTISGRLPQDTFAHSQMTTPGLPYSIADIDDISEMATTCRDDASTTTSGSYTINPDDLCNEIDELFFKDVIV